jgi:predicted transcriptional regulator
MFGIVSDELFEKQIEELESKKNSNGNGAEFKTIERGRGQNKEVPIELKKVIAEERINGGSAREISETFGVSESSVSAYKNGATSTSSYNEPNKELAKHNDKVKEVILEGARGKILMALESITQDKLENAKVRDAASVAKDMSAIIKNLEPAQQERAGLNQQFIFYTPKTKEEKDFDVVEMRD